MAVANTSPLSTVRTRPNLAVVLLTVGLLVTLSVTFHAPAASGEPRTDLPRLNDPPGLFTELTITGTVNGQAVGGFLASDDFDPLDGYPAGIPAGATEHDASFAGTIAVEDTLTGRTGVTYCIDLLTETQVGVNYKMGAWSDAEVPNLGYIAYILRNYFPTTGNPAAATSNNQRAAAVQAAIWFFSDRYVLDTTSPIRPLTQAIVTDTLDNGPAGEPRRPGLTVTPNQSAAPATGEIVGPFHVAADGPSTIHSYGVDVFTDSGGEHRLEDGDEIQPDATLWARSVSDTAPQGFVLERQVTVLVSTVYLYDGSNPGLDSAQKLVLAQDADLTRRAGALLTPFPAGALEVTKTIGGSGAGLQDEITIEVRCTDPNGELDQTYRRTLDPRSAAGRHLFRIGGILAGATCTITEAANGDNDFVRLRPVEITPETVTIAENETARASVTNTFDRASGALRVTKTITGNGAGHQGAIVVKLGCADAKFDRTFTIGAGTPAGTYPQTVVDGIPAGTRCAVTEQANGENAAVKLSEPTVVSPASTVITDDATATITVRNTYAPRDMAPSGDGVRTLPATGVSRQLMLATVASLVAFGVGLLLLLYQRRRAAGRRAAG
jgi:hypothetical protein